MALDDDITVERQLVGALGDRVHRDEDRARDARDLGLPRLANVEDERRPRTAERCRELAGGDLVRLGAARALLRAGDAAERFVVDELVDRGRLAAQRTMGVLLELEHRELHREGVEEEEPSDERLADAEDELDRLDGLDRAEDAGEHAEDAALRAARDEPGRRRLRVKTTIARPLPRVEDARLTLETEDARVHVRLSLERRDVVAEVARREVVRAVEEDIILAQQLVRVLRPEERLVRVDRDARVEVAEAFGRGRELRTADVLLAVEDLPVEVRSVDDVAVHEADATHARGCEVERRGAAQSAGAHEQDLRALELLLALHADLGHDEVARVVRHLLAREAHEREEGVLRLKPTLRAPSGTARAQPSRRLRNRTNALGTSSATPATTPMTIEGVTFSSTALTLSVCTE